MTKELSNEEIKKWEEELSPRYIEECRNFNDWERLVEAQEAIADAEKENIRDLLLNIQNLLLFNINNNLKKIADSLEEKE